MAAFLTILGYSMYDTMIVFDRIRENVPRMPRAAFSQIVNRSMSEVLTRSLITGLSTVFLIGVLLIFGGETLRGLRLRDDGRRRLRYLLVDLHRLAGADRSGRSASPPTARAARGSRRRWATCPTFPEENVVAKVDEDASRRGAAAGDAPPATAPRREPARRAAAPEPAEPRRRAPSSPRGRAPAPAPADRPEEAGGAGARPAEADGRRGPSAERQRKQQRRRRKHGRNR